MTEITRPMTEHVDCECCSKPLPNEDVLLAAFLGEDDTEDSEDSE